MIKIFKSLVSVHLLAASMLFVKCTDSAISIKNEELSATATSVKDSALVHSAPIDEDELITPGERVGKTKIGMTGDSLIAVLGKPDASDAAMGKAWMMWKSTVASNREVWVFTAYSDTSMMLKTVQLIETNSPYFSTAEGTNIGSTLDQIRTVFPKAAKVATRQGNDNIELYDAANGIAFEMEKENTKQTCVGIVVYDTIKNLTAIYQTFQPTLYAK